MATRLGLYNAALRLIGEASLASLTEDREPRRVLDEVYEDAILYCLETGLWNWAIRSIEASDVPSVVPTFGYQYAFTKPDDWLRTAGVWSSESESDALVDYSDEQEYWYANITPIYVRYVSSDNEYGKDLAKWSKTFTRYVESHLAAEICSRLTASKEGAEAHRKEEVRRLSEAKSKDAMDEPARFLPYSSWVRSRSGNGSNRSLWNRRFQ